MSGQLKEVRTRIKSVNSTQQITKAMKMVSAAKLRRSQDQITRLRPYAEKLKEILANILSGLDGDIRLPIATARPVQHLTVVLFTADRGLCGGFNANLYKRTLQLIREKYTDLSPEQITIYTIGKKGFAALRKHTYAVDDRFMMQYATGGFPAITAIAEFVVQQFLAGQTDAVEIVYSQFKNAATQVYQAEPFLPLTGLPVSKDDAASETAMDFIFEPDKASIIESLVPKILNTQMFKAFLDTVASEHGARMTAMDKATENANELLKTLRINYNRARQAAITTELSEIVAGAAALEG